ncbi:hypothetical protein BGX26_007226, partial [Mortierella sp. AD094]
MLQQPLQEVSGSQTRSNSKTATNSNAKAKANSIAVALNSMIKSKSKGSEAAIDTDSCIYNECQSHHSLGAAKRRHDVAYHDDVQVECFNYCEFKAVFISDPSANMNYF